MEADRNITRVPKLLLDVHQALTGDEEKGGERMPEAVRGEVAWQSCGPREVRIFMSKRPRGGNRRVRETK